MLLLDEPLGALDQKLRKEMQVELKRIQEQVGITFVYVTHDQEEALSMSDRVAVMSNGHIEQLDEPRAIYDRPLTPFVAEFIGEMNFFDGEVTASENGSFTLDVGSGVVVRARGQARDGDRVRVGVRSERMTAVGAGVAGRRRQLRAGRGDHQDVPRATRSRSSPARRTGRTSWCASSAPPPTRRSTPSTPATGSPSAGTRQLTRAGWSDRSTQSQGGDRAARHGRSDRDRRELEGGSMTDPSNDDMNILVPVEAKPRLDYLHREVESAAGFRMTRRQAARVGRHGSAERLPGRLRRKHDDERIPRRPARASTANPLAGKPLENKLQIYNWSQYDAPSTYTKFEHLPAEKAAGLNVNETYYSSNDELLAKLQCGRRRLRHHRAQPERRGAADPGRAS